MSHLGPFSYSAFVKWLYYQNVLQAQKWNDHGPNDSNFFPTALLHVHSIDTNAIMWHFPNSSTGTHKITENITETYVELVLSSEGRTASAAQGWGFQFCYISNLHGNWVCSVQNIKGIKITEMWTTAPTHGFILV